MHPEILFHNAEGKQVFPSDEELSRMLVTVTQVHVQTTDPLGTVADVVVDLVKEIFGTMGEVEEPEPVLDPPMTVADFQEAPNFQTGQVLENGELALGETLPDETETADPNAPTCDLADLHDTPPGMENPSPDSPPQEQAENEGEDVSTQDAEKSETHPDNQAENTQNEETPPPQNTEPDSH